MSCNPVVINSEASFSSVVGAFANSATSALAREHVAVCPFWREVQSFSCNVVKFLFRIFPVLPSVLAVITAFSVSRRSYFHALFAGVMPAIVMVFIARKGFEFTGSFATATDLHSRRGPALSAQSGFLPPAKLGFKYRAWLAGRAPAVFAGCAPMELIYRLGKRANAACLCIHYSLRVCLEAVI